MPLEPGSTVGSYRIVAPLGAGGMGEVYRATDTRLARDVAIKLLPEEFARQPDRLARFEREAKVLASLNHPGIAAIYGLEESGGLRCLVLELVEGRTLHELIEAGPVPVEQAMRYALQMTEALEAAHEKGIIHRDLKPANVMVTPEGKVKILDFGLAKAFAEDHEGSTDASMSPTLTVAATQAGIIIGTAAYMSPEQAAGQAADRRSDIWSFGVVVLEMLTGRRVFSGETVSHVLASVLKDEPDWDRLPAALPPRLGDLIRLCLRKKARRRLQAIGDARILIEEYLTDPEAFGQAATQAHHEASATAAKMAWLPWAIAALLALGLAATLWLRPGPPATEPPVTRLSIPGPEGETMFQGYGSSVVLSPDGSRLAYVTIKNGEISLYVQELDQWEPRLVMPGKESAYHPFFSPDGQWLGYVTLTELKKVPVRGGSPLTLCSVDRNRGATWTGDGTIIFAPDPGSGLFSVPAAGGEPRPLTTLDEEKNERSHRWPQALPSGRAVLFTSMSGEGADEKGALEILDLESGTRRILRERGSYGRYVPSGHIVYADGGTLFAFPFDLATLEATGSPAPVLENISSSDGRGSASFDVSEDGTLVYVTGSTESQGTTLVWVDADGAATTIWDESRSFGRPRISPDGRRLALEIREEGEVDIWIYDLERGVPSRLTFDKGVDTHPVWSPDGAWIYYSSQRGGGRDIFRRASDGSGEPEPVLALEDPAFPSSLSPDGKVLLFFRPPGDVWQIRLEGGEPELFEGGPGVQADGHFSPDGRWIAYVSDESGPMEVYVRPASGGGGKWQISSGGGRRPRWSGDGRALYYRNTAGTVMRARVESEGDEFRSGRSEALFDGPYLYAATGATSRYDVAPDGERFVMLQVAESVSQQHDHIRVVRNWTGELRRILEGSGGTP